jgi:cytoskeletal protein CcmA (bactofilin family)
MSDAIPLPTEEETSGPHDRLLVAARTPCRVPQGVVIKGELLAHEDVVVEGLVDGHIDVPGHCVTILQKGRVNARIFARDVTVLGAFTGRLTATEIVDIRETATVNGTITTRRIALRENARVQGRIETRRHMDAAAEVARYRRERG